jgi:D-alanine transaminase
MRTVYVNGRYVPESEGVVSIFDRGFMMSDSVYEVTGVIAGRMLDFDAHMARLQRSMGELAMPKGARPG